MTYKEEFIDLFTANVHREGSAHLLEWLQTTDFFTAPASTKYHGACECGLVMHSLNVYHVLMEKHFVSDVDNPESFAICALLHDLCKAQFYKTSTPMSKIKKQDIGKKFPFIQLKMFSLTVMVKNPFFS